MAFDAHKNLAVATVVTAPSPATSGTSLVVGAGEGARFPAAPFNCTIWPVDMAPTPATAEVVRVTARTTDTLTITRAQEGTTARAVVAGDLIAATITAQSLTDIESGLNFGALTCEYLLFNTTGAQHTIRNSTPDGADNHTLVIAGGGSSTVDRGAVFTLSGNESGSQGALNFAAGAPAGTINFDLNVGTRGRMHPSGGFSWGDTTDPGAGNLSVSKDLYFAGGVAAHLIAPSTNVGADTSYLYLCSGGGMGADRGASFNAHGNNVAGAGGIAQVIAGNVASAYIGFYTGPLAERGRIHPSGGFSWGGSTDPGAGSFSFTNAIKYGAIAFGSDFIELGNVPTVTPCGMRIGAGLVAGATMIQFANLNGHVGNIQCAGTNTIYNTTSDARLKTPLNRHTDPSVLRDTVIHNFVWKSDGTPGRGVFAQEAVEVAPFAVSVGGDEVDGHGLLLKPWGVDYSKYVPDLIVGWQAHDAKVCAMEDRIAFLEGVRWSELYGTTPPPPAALRMTLWQRVRNFINGLWPAWITP